MIAEFLGDIAFALEALVFGIGLVVWHFAGKEKSRKLNIAGGFLTIVGVLGMLCTGYYYLTYWSQGAFMYSKTLSGPMMNQNMMGENMGGMGMMGQNRDGAMMNGQNMHNMMMQNMNTCMSQMSGMTMDEEGMGKMRSCMMGIKNAP